MHSTIQKALQYLQKADYVYYFEEMDKVVPTNLQTLYQEHKGKFMAGQAPWNFYQQLEIFAREVDKTLNTSPIKEEKPISPTITTQHQPFNNMSKKVFISYNHGDKDAARHLKNALIKEGIEVTIDSEAMLAGSKISDFIRKGILETDVTVSIVSEKSLLSAWVAMESILTLHSQKQFIACYITDKFFNNDFVDNCEDEIDIRINELNTEIKERLEKARGIEHLTDELTRQRDLKHNLSKFIGELRSRLCIDITGYNFLDNVPRVIKAIKSIA